MLLNTEVRLLCLLRLPRQCCKPVQLGQLNRQAGGADDGGAHVHDHGIVYEFFASRSILAARSLRCCQGCCLAVLVPPAAALCVCVCVCAREHACMWMRACQEACSLCGLRFVQGRSAAAAAAPFVPRPADGG
eukprot:1147666-Pelagomonas_calceolata.AAC.1